MPLQHPSTGPAPDTIPDAINELYANDLYLDGRITTQLALLSSVSYAAFGSAPGTVADGGALAAEIARAQAAEQANATAIQANATAISNEVSRAQAAELLKAPIASPIFTGTPTAPTAANGTNTNQIATCAFVLSNGGTGGGGGGTGGVPATRLIGTSGLATGGGDLSTDRTITVPAASQADVAAGTDQTKALTSFSIAAALGAKAALASPTFVGTPTAPTASAGANTAQIATTAFVSQAIGNVQRTAFRFVATAGQTAFSGTDAASLTFAYTVGLIAVFVNGRRLSPPDFTATDGTSVVIASGLSAGEEVLIIADAAFSVANTYTQAQSDAQYARRFNVMAKTAAYSVTIADTGKLIACSGTWALTLPSAAAAGNGFAIEVSNTGTGKITATLNGTDTISGAATLVINQKESGILVSDGANWQAVGFAPVIIYAGTGVNDYRKWSNGWTEQWGMSPGQTADRVVTFPIPFTSIQKMPRGTIMTAASSVAVIYGVHIDSLTVNNFILRARYMSNSGGVVVGAAGENISWSCEGYS